MKSEQLIEILQQDLRNERLHMNFYLQAASLVSGPHREEYKEYFMKEAQSEMEHVKQFADVIVYLGGIPEVVMTPLKDSMHWITNDLNCLLGVSMNLEEEVANNYAERLNLLDNETDANSAWVHLFYEDQLQDSWAAAKELKQLLLNNK